MTSPINRLSCNGSPSTRDLAGSRAHGFPWQAHSYTVPELDNCSPAEDRSSATLQGGTYYQL